MEMISWNARRTPQRTEFVKPNSNKIEQ